MQWIYHQQQLAMKSARAGARPNSPCAVCARCAGARSPHGAHLERCSIRRLGRGFLPSGILRYEKFWWSVRHHSAIKQQKRKTEIFIFQNLPKFSVKLQQISANLGTNIHTLRSLKKIECEVQKRKGGVVFRSESSLFVEEFPDLQKTHLTYERGEGGQ